MWQGISSYALNTNAVAKCLTITTVFAAVEALLFVLVPGEVFDGPVTPGGCKPKYKDNGFRCFIITHALLWASTSNLDYVAHHHGSLLVVLNIGALLFCAILYLKGIYMPTFAPPDSGRTGHGYLFDYYWGTELHPRLSSTSLFDIKQWVNCRLGMMGWSVLLVAFLHAHMADNGGVASNGFLCSFVLQQVYIAKFFYWERGYMASIDIMHDRLGFYICWGCLVWLPSLYPSGAYHLFLHSRPGAEGRDMPAWVAAATTLVGIACVVITYLADEQRQEVRRSDAKKKVWGKEPSVIRAEYISSDNRTHKSILLTCGWWSIARHFHYVTEWSGAFLWTLPVVWVAGSSVLAWTYPIFLFILLAHRAARDEERCSRKYGQYWVEYTKAVPYRIFPYVF